MPKSKEELDAITRAYARPKRTPEELAAQGIRVGGGVFSLTDRERKAYEKKKKAAQDRANAIGKPK